MTRIVYEDEGLESFAMDGDSMIAVPIEVTKDADGDFEIRVYSRFEKEAGELAARQPDDPLSKEAVGFIEKTFSPLMRDAGFEYESGVDHTVLNYAADAKKLKKPDADCKVVMLDTNDKIGEYYFATTRDIEVDDSDPADVIFAAVRGDVVLAASSVNDYSDDGSLEINVETAVNERGKGFASAVVYAMCDYLLSLGDSVSYKCRESNAASVGVAERCGLVYTGKTYSFVCYKD